MSPEYAEQLWRVFDLIEAGVLPSSASERLCYMGHTVLYCFGHDSESRKFKCVTCLAEWQGLAADDEPHLATCTQAEVYETNFRRDARWRCTNVNVCHAEWVGEDGDRCPSCGFCHHVWSFTLAECSLCQKNKDEYMEELPPRQRPAEWVPGYYQARVDKGEVPS